MKKIITNLLSVLFLPLLLFKDVFKSSRSILRKTGWWLLILILLVPMWRESFLQVVSLVKISLFDAGIIDKLTKVQIQGTSMLPTIEDGSEVALNSPKKYGLARGDIVSFKNLETGGLYYLKRIVGLPGETVSLKNGFVFINGQALQEDYVLNNLPTFGNTFLVECENYLVPKDHFLVFGDNRTVSSDSRFLGFINKNDIEGVIKKNLSAQFLPPNAQKEIFKKEVKAANFLEKINQLRSGNKNPLLAATDELNLLAQNRAEQIRDNFEEWKKQTIPVGKLLDQKGYRYNLVNEYVTFGYLDEEEILNQILDSPVQKEAFTSPKYTEIGIGITEKTQQECAFPIISVILSWPSIPTYNQKTIDSWTKEMEATNKILANMQTWVNYPGADQAKVRKIIDLTAQQNEIASRIQKKMTSREWLSEKDDQDIKLYNELVNQGNALLSDFLGKKVQGAFTQKIEDF